MGGDISIAAVRAAGTHLSDKPMVMSCPLERHLPEDLLYLFVRLNSREIRESEHRLNDPAVIRWYGYLHPSTL
jgi:hypothetical protein